jgi:hypothetical protein
VGDIWPYGAPFYGTWQEAHRAVTDAGGSDYTATILAAIGTAESGIDLTVINDTPSTGDYSVGVWQINYYNGLYDSRTAAFGTPEQLINSGLPGQAKAALSIVNSSGFSPWSTYNSGAYKAYLHGAPAPTAGSRPQTFPTIPVPDPTSQDSWGRQVRYSGDNLKRVAIDALRHGSAVRQSYR